MRVLVVTNITPDKASPSRGVFVRDQVAALRRAGVEVELYSFPRRPVELSPARSRGSAGC